ncbi:MAG TPA: UvrB/UvrC motif-containing protein, partial [Longimicrobiales bacterium]|nr:UvrB/UvrC motif-containing protein [Longimicrobiales bacterium]
EECGGNEAVVHLTQVVNNEMTVTHLCEACAAQKGLETSSGPISPLSDFIAQMGGAPPPPSGSQEACPFCGLTYADFKEVGRLGCPECWSTFQEPLEKLVRRVHGSSHHVGKVYLPPDPSASEMQKRLEGLRNRLERAVESEDFERAAQLRDQIRSLEPRG